MYVFVLFIRNISIDEEKSKRKFPNGTQKKSFYN